MGGTSGRSIQTAKTCRLEDYCSKCKFFKDKIHYPGYLVSVDGVQPLPDKLEVSRNY